MAPPPISPLPIGCPTASLASRLPALAPKLPSSARLPRSFALSFSLTSSKSVGGALFVRNDRGGGYPPLPLAAHSLLPGDPPPPPSLPATPAVCPFRAHRSWPTPIARHLARVALRPTAHPFALATPAPAPALYSLAPVIACRRIRPSLPKAVSEGIS